MKSISLSLRKCGVNGDLCMISIRDHKTNEITQEKFKSDAEAYSKYLELTKQVKKIVVEEIKIEDLKEDDSKEDQESLIVNYANDNIALKGVKSARHLNKVFGLKLKQKKYDEILKELNE